MADAQPLADEWPTGWRVESVAGSVEDLHRLGPPDSDDATLWLMEPTDAALVLGSAQRNVAVDALGLATQSLSTVRRSSGGGAVIIDASTAWIDVWIPRSGARWTEDLGATFLSVGRAWELAFADLGVEAELFEQRPERSAVSDAVCFAGMGWGEVSVGGAKAVGLSQRRTRWGARVQCLAVDTDHTRAVAALLGVDPSLLPPKLPADRFNLADLRAAFLTRITATASPTATHP